MTARTRLSGWLICLRYIKQHALASTPCKSSSSRLNPVRSPHRVSSANTRNFADRAPHYSHTVKTPRLTCLRLTKPTLDICVCTPNNGASYSTHSGTKPPQG
ncbi:hypothetical protein F4823DRAFT_606836 [Ustulina deusta]|nr:hypothetical protein F4823DRAFT_606836 [Ustulina deusta]